MLASLDRQWLWSQISNLQSLEKKRGAERNPIVWSRVFFFFLSKRCIPILLLWSVTVNLDLHWPALIILLDGCIHRISLRSLTKVFRLNYWTLMRTQVQWHVISQTLVSDMLRISGDEEFYQLSKETVYEGWGMLLSFSTKIMKWAENKHLSYYFWLWMQI